MGDNKRKREVLQFYFKILKNLIDTWTFPYYNTKRSAERWNYEFV